MRNLLRNKKSTLCYSNVSETTIDDYGATQLVYDTAKCLKLCIQPLTNFAEAENYGVDYATSSKVILEPSQASLFNERTKLWLDIEPTNDANYYVSSLPKTTLNECVMIITKLIAK